MRFGSLFSGIGGFDLGFTRAGMQCAWQVELDKACQHVLEYRLPDVRRYADVREVGNGNLEPVDLVCGGFPCQDLSVAGRRAGLAGERSGLWFEFHRILEEVKPQWVVVENVPGLLSSNGGRDFAVILRGLAELGYGVCWRILDSQYFGVPQRRRRVFIVGHLGDGRAAEILFELESSIGDTAPRRKAGERVATSAEDGATSTLRGFGHDWQGQHNDTNAVITRPLTAAMGTKWNGNGDLESSLIACTQDSIAGAVSSKWHKGAGGPAGDERYNLVAYSVRTAQTGANGIGVREEQAHTLDGTGEAALIHNPRQFSGSENLVGFIPLIGVRRLTPTECERLQGFPDGWTAGQSDSQRYRQLGNAVTVNVIKWLGRRIMEAT